MACPTPWVRRSMLQSGGDQDDLSGATAPCDAGSADSASRHNCGRTPDHRSSRCARPPATRGRPQKRNPGNSAPKPSAPPRRASGRWHGPLPQDRPRAAPLPSRPTAPEAKPGPTDAHKCGRQYACQRRQESPASPSDRQLSLDVFDSDIVRMRTDASAVTPAKDHVTSPLQPLGAGLTHDDFGFACTSNPQSDTHGAIST